MITAVIPAFNEAKSLPYVIHNLQEIDIDKIILVANGCNDNTCEQTLISTNKSILHMLCFSERLGFDIPRAVGAVFALRFNPDVLLFIDGDMKGEISPALLDLITGVQKGLDMALTNCYPYVYQRSDLALSVIKERENLNRKLGLFNKLGLASPSHGPHAVSGSLLRSLPPQFIAIPPLSLTYAAINGFDIEVAATIPHMLLGSQFRDNEHATLIAETIIGDCRHALSYASGTPLEQVINSQGEQTGYRAKRRFDILNSFIKAMPL